MTPKHYRQGDVLFIKIDTIPKHANSRKSKVLVEGETTGHSHRLVNGQVFTTFDQMYIDAYPGAEIVHEEHATIPLPPGTYRVVRQREYDPQTREQTVFD